MSEKILNLQDRVNVSTQATISDGEISKVYNELDKKNTDKEKLQAAENEVSDSKLEPLNSSEDTITGGIDTSKVEEEEHNYSNAFDPYDLSDDQAKQLIEVIYDFKAGKNLNDLYNQLPAKAQEIADGFYQNARAQNQPISKNNCARFIIESFINDAKMDKALEDYQQQMEETLREMDNAYGDIYRSAMEDIFSKIDELKETNPEKAERLEKIKTAFEDTESFNKQSEFLDRISAKKLNKLLNFRYSDMLFYFNKKVNVTEVKMPDINELVDIISINLPDYDEDTIKKFIICIMQSIDVNNIERDITILAYTYKLINNIYDYKFYVDDESEHYKKIFGNIATILDKIKNKL